VPLRSADTFLWKIASGSVAVGVGKLLGHFGREGF
jgi:hypothetical protein